MSGTVLIVEDDGDIRDVVRIALSQAGFQTEEAPTGLLVWLRLNRSSRIWSYWTSACLKWTGLRCAEQFG